MAKSSSFVASNLDSDKCNSSDYTATIRVVTFELGFERDVAFDEVQRMYGLTVFARTVFT